MKKVRAQKLKPYQVRSFRNTVLGYYKKHKRDLPWRRTNNPYCILVSEIMLQQTQVPRVIEKYKSFIRRFPTVQHLARAGMADVLREWQGLGYNRRALYLKRAADVVTSNYNGKIPKTTEELIDLPGIGHATAAAICTYAFNMPMVFIETNIRTVFIHHFFPQNRDVSDKSIQSLVAATLDHENPREWYSALMDYGTHIKQTAGNLARQSKHYTRQSTFRGSDREIRGKILRILAKRKYVDVKSVSGNIGTDQSRIERIITDLVCEGFVKKSRSRLSLV